MFRRARLFAKFPAASGNEVGLRSSVGTVGDRSSLDYMVEINNGEEYKTKIQNERMNNLLFDQK